MRHRIPVESLGPVGEPMARAVQACVHCGFCLPTCPTYQVLGQEMDSPRGRIYLMKEVLEGGLPLEGVLLHIDRCLGCLACVTACPSGVAYHELVSPFRDRAERKRRRTPLERLRRFLVLETLPYPARMRWAFRLGRVMRPLRRLVPKAMRPLLDLLPERVPAPRPLPPLTPARGPRRARVALLTGCVQQVLEPDIGWASLEVLARNGVEVAVPPGQVCCGALAWHAGDGDRARALARINLQAFPQDVDAIVTNAAGCGSGMHEYPLMLKGTEEEAAAQAFASRIRDISVLLEEVGIVPPPPLDGPRKAAYHDACHLGHAQSVRQAPRRLLQCIGNLDVLEIDDGETCCGSAGTYNLDQPEIAADLGRRKARHIFATGCDLVAAGNIGCLVQIRSHLRRYNRAPQALHTIQILHRAYERRL